MSKKRKHVFWFDIHLTYEELTFLNSEAKRLRISHMEYLAKLLREKMEG